MDIGVIGAGAWGTAFSMHLARKGHRCLLWVYEPELCDALRERRENAYYLPGVMLPQQIEFTDNLEKAVAFAENIVIAVPSFALRATLGSIQEMLAHKNMLVLTKGLETETFLRMSEVAEQTVEEAHIATLSGPSFAKEVAHEAFTSVVVSSTDRELSKYFQGIIHSDNFRVYTCDDIIGVELGGAMKNVMAIGAGIIEGLALGANTQAAFTTRALAEIKRLGKVLGAKETTFMGLSGIGDLILTSYGHLSRNRAFGMELAKGRKPLEAIKAQKHVIEGYYTARAAHVFSKTLGIEMPITAELYKIMYQGKDLQTSLKDIKSRALKEEEY